MSMSIMCSIASMWVITLSITFSPLVSMLMRQLSHQLQHSSSPTETLSFSFSFSLNVPAFTAHKLCRSSESDDRILCFYGHFVPSGLLSLTDPGMLKLLLSESTEWRTSLIICRLISVSLSLTFVLSCSFCVFLSASQSLSHLLRRRLPS